MGENMSKKLVAVHNYTDRWLTMGGNATGYPSWGQESGTFYRKGKHPMNYPVPDNSDSSKYFASNHISVNIHEPETGKYQKEFSVWDDDDKSYKIFYCQGTDWKNSTSMMRGGDKGKDGDRVILHVAEHPARSGNYELTSVVLTDDERKKQVGRAFLAFKNHPQVNLTPGVKYTNQQLQTFMTHPSFRSVRETAAEGGYKSVAVIIGAEGSLVIGGEAYSGVLMGVDGGSESYRMTTIAASIGAQEGVVAFVGTYVSTEEPSQVGGVEFFAQFAADLGIGVSYSPFVGLHGSGFSLRATTGEELEAGVGVGDTWTAKISAQAAAA